MHVFWTDGDKDLALAFLDMEGYVLFPATIVYRSAKGGWEQRISKKPTPKQLSDREREKLSRVARDARLHTFDN
jgi:hypothetical protein